MKENAKLHEGHTFQVGYLPSLLCVLHLVLLPAGAKAQIQHEYPAWLTACEIVGIDGEVLCGRYEVWEDRQAQSGRRVSMHVIVVPARSEDRRPDPLFHLEGGPGVGGSSWASDADGIYRSISENRDIVIIDQRGTGLSSPLKCPEQTDGDDLQRYFTEFLSDDLVRDCLAHQTADVTQYTTPVAMDDINEIREALGYDKINVAGASYGTMAAQVYTKRHAGTVRTAILRRVSPMDMEAPLPFSKALHHGVDGLIDACMAEPACRKAYPDLRDDWERSQAYFDRGTVTAVVTHPTSGRSQRVLIHRGTYADGVRHILYLVESSRSLPGMIFAAGRGDFDAFAQRELEQSIALGDMLSIGAFLTVTCAEELRFVDEEDIRLQTRGTFLGDYRVRRQLAACAIWGFGEGIDRSSDLSRFCQRGGIRRVGIVMRGGDCSSAVRYYGWTFFTQPVVS